MSRSVIRPRRLTGPAAPAAAVSFASPPSKPAVPTAAHDGPALPRDLGRLMQAGLQRRHALRWLAGAGVLPLMGCGGGGDAAGGTAATPAASSSTTTVVSSTNAAVSSCSLIPEETAGPYPGDGSNSTSAGLVNALALSGIVRSDIRSSIAGATGTADGVPLTVQLRLVDTSSSCADLSGYAVYLWHCDRLGRYSMYASALTGENYLRGVQESDANGLVSFTTIFPGCYDGRMPHIHFEVYRSANSATSFSNKLRTSQIAFPEDICQTIYSTSGYESSATHFARMSFSNDLVFSDGVSLQMAEVTGSVIHGVVASLVVGVAG